jgi:hypothetical protein
MIIYNIILRNSYIIILAIFFNQAFLLLIAILFHIHKRKNLSIIKENASVNTYNQNKVILN